MEVREAPTPAHSDHERRWPLWRQWQWSASVRPCARTQPSAKRTSSSALRSHLAGPPLDMREIMGPTLSGEAGHFPCLYFKGTGWGGRMHYLALAADYDGTLASHDRIPEETVRAVERLRTSGRRAILVTGRRVDDLLLVCPCARLFDLVVAENGPVVYNPATREKHYLANPPPKLLIKGLLERGVEPLEIGQVLVGTHAAHRAAVQDVTWELGLGAQVIGDRPTFLAQLVPNLQALRARTGRPHWLVLDEAHHMFPDTWGHTGSALPERLGETLLVTVHPEHVAPEILAPIDIVIAIGSSPQDTLARFGRATGRAVP